MREVSISTGGADKVGRGTVRAPDINHVHVSITRERGITECTAFTSPARFKDGIYTVTVALQRWVIGGVKNTAG